MYLCIFTMFIACGADESEDSSLCDDSDCGPESEESVVELESDCEQNGRRIVSARASTAMMRIRRGSRGIRSGASRSTGPPNRIAPGCADPAVRRAKGEGQRRGRNVARRARGKFRGGGDRAGVPRPLTPPPSDEVSTSPPSQRGTVHHRPLGGHRRRVSSPRQEPGDVTKSPRTGNAVINSPRGTFSQSDGDDTNMTSLPSTSRDGTLDAPKAGDTLPPDTEVYDLHNIAGYSIESASEEQRANIELALANHAANPPVDSSDDEAELGETLYRRYWPFAKQLQGDL